MALSVDATNTPAIAVNSVSTQPDVVSNSFTQADGSVLLIRWAGNSASGTPGPAQPTITDSLGSHLTYTLLDWESISDPGGSPGQSATWVATVTTGAVMTITVTSGVSTSDKQSVLSVLVFTGADPVTPIGDHGKGGAPGSSVSQTYTALGTNGWGFMTVCDWDAVGSETAGTGCTILGPGNGTGSVGTNISYAFLSRTINDDSDGVNNTLTANLPASSNNITMTYAEVLEDAGGGGGGGIDVSGGTPWPWRSE